MIREWWTMTRYMWAHHRCVGFRLVEVDLATGFYCYRHGHGEALTYTNDPGGVIDRVSKHM